MAEQQDDPNHSLAELRITDISPRLLDALLSDKSTGHNIVWATSHYEDRGDGYEASLEIFPELITQANSALIQPRVLRASKEQTARTRKHAEVATPAWICNRMNNYCDEVWFGRKDVFNLEADTSWAPVIDKVAFPEGKTWQQYVDSRRLEITCGEAPFLVSRYDAVTGEILDLPLRIGVLDRKLRVVNENAADQEEWLKWAIRAVQSVYGYEYQGDSLVVARINVLMTFRDYFCGRWQNDPPLSVLLRVCNIIVWNLWQMDGLKGTVPVGALGPGNRQITFWGIDEPVGDPERTPCKIYDWRSKVQIPYTELHKRGKHGMKFDFAIGNPPYQTETDSDSTRMLPVYHTFMEAAYSVATAVELITPARFLFNAGFTPKAWNDKMLHDPHFKVLYYEPDSSAIFANTSIEGGISVSYRDADREFGPIETFTAFPELNSILRKVTMKATTYLDSISYPALSYSLSDRMIRDFPNSFGRLRTSAFEKIPEIFCENVPQDGNVYMSMLGLLDSKRVIRYVRQDYIKTPENFEYYKVFVPKANGASGTLGTEAARIISKPVLGMPFMGHTQTFLSIGKLETEEEGQNLLKYVKSKFCRALLGVLKITQDNPGPKWRYVPAQDFTAASDIDWSQPISGIDQQLFKKYGLSPAEVAFIESHVKEME